MCRTSRWFWPIRSTSTGWGSSRGHSRWGDGGRRSTLFLSRGSSSSASFSSSPHHDRWRRRICELNRWSMLDDDSLTQSGTMPFVWPRLSPSFRCRGGGCQLEGKRHWALWRLSLSNWEIGSILVLARRISSKPSGRKITRKSTTHPTISKCDRFTTEYRLAVSMWIPFDLEHCLGKLWSFSEVYYR